MLQPCGDKHKRSMIRGDQTAWKKTTVGVIPLDVWPCNLLLWMFFIGINLIDAPFNAHGETGELTSILLHFQPFNMSAGQILVWEMIQSASLPVFVELVQAVSFSNVLLKGEMSKKETQPVPHSTQTKTNVLSGRSEGFGFSFYRR